MPPKAALIIFHVLGIPISIATFLNITFDTWQGWIMLILSSVYVLGNIIISFGKGIIWMQNAMFDLKVKKGKYVPRSMVKKK